MGCGGCEKKKRKKCMGSRKRKRLPSINPFFHFLKCVWRKFRGCKRSVVIRYAVKKWRKMSKNEKQPFYDAACRAQAMHRTLKKHKENGCQSSHSKPRSKSCKKKKKKVMVCPKC